MPGAVAVKATIAVVAAVAGTAITMYGQAQAAKAAKGKAAYNAQLNRMDIEQNNRNRVIEKQQDKKRYYLQQEKAANNNMSLDFRFADLESFEYNALLKDYNVAQANTTLEARARGGIYAGNVQAAAAKTQMLGTAIGGIGSASAAGTDTKTGKSLIFN